MRQVRGIGSRLVLAVFLGGFGAAVYAADASPDVPGEFKAGVGGAGSAAGDDTSSPFFGLGREKPIVHDGVGATGERADESGSCMKNGLDVFTARSRTECLQIGGSWSSTTEIPMRPARPLQETPEEQTEPPRGVLNAN